jgi:hypothetical protein
MDEIAARRMRENGSIVFTGATPGGSYITVEEVGGIARPVRLLQ